MVSTTGFGMFVLFGTSSHQRPHLARNHRGLYPTDGLLWLGHHYVLIMPEWHKSHPFQSGTTLDSSPQSLHHSSPYSMIRDASLIGGVPVVHRLETCAIFRAFEAVHNRQVARNHIND